MSGILELYEQIERKLNSMSKAELAAKHITREPDHQVSVVDYQDYRCKFIYTMYYVKANNLPYKYEFICEDRHGQYKYRSKEDYQRDLKRYRGY